MTYDQWIEVLKYLSVLLSSITASIAAARWRDKRVPAQNLKDKSQADLDISKAATALLEPMRTELNRTTAKVAILEEQVKRLTGKWRLVTEFQMGDPAYVEKQTLEPILSG